MASSCEGRRSCATSLSWFACLLAIGTAAACFDSRAHGGLTPEEHNRLIAILALVAGSMLLGFILPIAFDHDATWFRIVRGVLLAAAAAGVFVGTVAGFVKLSPRGGTPGGLVDPFIACALVPYLVPIIYGVVAKVMRARRGDA